MARNVKHYPKGTKRGGQFMPKVGADLTRLNPLAALARKRRAADLRTRSAARGEGSFRASRPTAPGGSSRTAPPSAHRIHEPKRTVETDATMRAERDEYERKRAKARRGPAKAPQASRRVVRASVPDPFQDGQLAAAYRGPAKRGGPKKGGPPSQTREQAEAVRAQIQRLGTPTREETLPDGTRKFEWKIGTRTIRKSIRQDGSIDQGGLDAIKERKAVAGEPRGASKIPEPGTDLQKAIREARARNATAVQAGLPSTDTPATRRLRTTASAGAQALAAKRQKARGEPSTATGGPLPRGGPNKGSDTFADTIGRVKDRQETVGAEMDALPDGSIATSRFAPGRWHKTDVGGRPYWINEDDQTQGRSSSTLVNLGTTVELPDGTTWEEPPLSRDNVDIDLGRGQDSKGHLDYLGRFEYFVAPDGSLVRAPRDSPIDTRTGYRVGARFESMPRKDGFEAYLKPLRDRETKQVVVELDPEVFKVVKERNLDAPEQPKGEVAQRIFGDATDTQELFSTETDGKRVYSPERKKLHDKIVAAALAGAVKPEGKPHMVFLAGGSGSGKSTARARLEEEGAMPGNAVEVDADAIKEQLPEFAEMAAAKDTYSARGAHEESSDIAKRIQAEAQEAGFNIVLDGTGNAGPGKFKGKMETASAKGYDVDVVVVNAPTGEAMERAIRRAERSGRYVPIPAMREIHKSVSAAHYEWKDSPAVKSWRVYDNAGEGPPILAAQRDASGEQIHDPQRYNEFTAKREEDLKAEIASIAVTDKDLEAARKALGQGEFGPRKGSAGQPRRIPIRPRDTEAALRAGRLRAVARASDREPASKPKKWTAKDEGRLRVLERLARDTRLKLREREELRLLRARRPGRVRLLAEQGPGGIGTAKPPRRTGFVWVKATPKRKGHWRKRRPGETRGAGGGRRQIAKAGLPWGGRIFKSTKELRAWIEERGGSWEKFKAKFGAAHEGLMEYERRHGTRHGRQRAKVKLHRERRQLRASRLRRGTHRPAYRTFAEAAEQTVVPPEEWFQWIPADPASWDDLEVTYEGDQPAEPETKLAEFTLNDAIEYADVVYAAVPNFQAVGPRAKGKLAPLMAHYGKMAHPFTACVADNTKRFGPERAKRVCAVLKDLIRGTTKWRSTERSKAYTEFQAVVAFSDEVDEQALDDFARWLDDADLSRLL